RRRNARAVVVAPEAPLRPAVVAARQDRVDLVATVGPVLGGQHRAARMHDEAELVAVPIAEHLGPRAGLALERIVGGHAAVLAQAQHLAVDVVQLLRLAVERRTRGYVQESVRRKRQPRAAGSGLPFAGENLLDVFQRTALELAATYRQRRLPARRLRVGHGLAELV